MTPQHRTVLLDVFCFAGTADASMKGKSEYNLDLYSSVQRVHFFVDFPILFCSFACQYAIP